MMQPTLETFHTLKGEASIQEIFDHVVKIMNINPEVLTIIHGSDGRMTEVEYRLHWTRTYLKRAGLIDNPSRGHWCLTAKGQATQRIEPSQIVATVKQQLRDEQKVAVEELLQSDSEATTSAESVEASVVIESEDPTHLKSPTPNLPNYSQVRYFLKILNGTAYATYRHMYNTIWEQRGNPQEQTEWADPDLWITDRLEGDDKTLALKLWTESAKQLNPRYLRGCWYLATRHDLLYRDTQGMLQVTQSGQRFLAADAQVIVAIDDYEGILTILRLVAEKGPGKRSEFLTGYGDYCRTSTTMQ
jgi:hypothetical protein